MATVQDIVRVNATISNLGSGAGPSLNSLLFATADRNALDPTGSGKVNSYSTLLAVGEDFASGTEAYQAAATYFRQTPFPPPMKIARWEANGSAATLTGGATVGTAASIDAMSGTEFVIPVGGTAVTVSPEFGLGTTGTPASMTGGAAPGSTAQIDDVTGTSFTFSLGGNSVAVAPVLGSVASHDDVAAALQTAIRASSVANTNDVVVEYDSDADRYVLRGSFDDYSALTITAATGALATLIRMTNSDNPTIVPGVDRRVFSYSEIARAVETAIQASSVDGADLITVQYDAVDGVFVVQGGFASDGSSYSLGAATGALATSMDLTAVRASVAAGVDRETFSAFLNEVTRYDDNWYYVALDRTIIDTPSVAEASTGIGGTDRILVLDTSSSGVLEEQAGDPVLQIVQAGPERTAVVYSGTRDYKAVSLAGRFASVNLDSPGSSITAKFKILPGTTPDDFSDDDRAVLDRLRINHYTLFGPSAILVEGVMPKDGVFFDTRTWLDWFVRSVQNEVLALLRNSPKVPQTSTGIASLRSVVTAVCERAVANGGVAGGKVSEAIAGSIRAATGNATFDGDLANGYLVYIAPITSLSADDAAARRVPAIRVWLKGADAIHFVDVEIDIS